MRFAEVNRNALHGGWASRCSSRARISPAAIDDPAVSGAGFRRRHASGVQRLPEPVLLQRNEGIGGVLQGPRRPTGSFQSLAEPNLIAYNGEEASFLAGGEIPVPVVQRQHRQRQRRPTRSSASA